MTLPAPAPTVVPPEATEPDEDESSPAALLVVVGVSTLVVILCVLGATLSGLFSFVTVLESTSALGSALPTGAVSARAPGTSFPDGQWVIGGDIQPGTYSVTVAAGSSGCTWERNAATDGTASAVLESGTGIAGEAIVVSIKDTDKAFQSKGCGAWQRLGD